MWISIFIGLSLVSFGLFNAYLIVFGLFLPKTEEKREIPILNIFFKYQN